MSVTRKIARNTIVQMGAKVISTILGLITIGLLTRYLGQEGFGHYSTIMGFLQFFGIMVDFGLTLTTAQMMSDPRYQEEKVFANILSLRVISATLFLGLAPLVSLLFPYEPFVKSGIAFMTLSFFFISLVQVFLGFYQKHLQLKYVAAAEIGGRIFLFAAVLVALWLDYGLFGMLAAIMLSNAVQVIMLWLPAKKFTPIKFEIDRAMYKAIFVTTWPIALSIGLSLIYVKSDIIILSLYRPAWEVGLYGAAYKVLDVLMVFPFLFAGMLLPLMTTFWKLNDISAFKRLFQQGFDTMILTAIPLVVGTYFVGHDVMALVAGEEFRAAGTLLQLLILGLFFIFFQAMFSHAIVAIDKQKSTIFAYAITAAIGLSGYFILIPSMGALGAAITTVVTEGIVACLVVFMTIKFTGLRPNMTRLKAALLSSAGMTALLWLTTDWHVLLRVIIAVVAYGALLFLTKGISKTFLLDIMTLRKNRLA